MREQNRPGLPGELAVIFDRENRFLAIGLYDPDSPLRMRVLHAGKPLTIDTAWWGDQLRLAVNRRSGLFDEQTTGYRWINGESDGWPGLVLDRYDSTLVLKLYTAAWLPRLMEITALIEREFSTSSIVLRLSRNIQALAQRQFQLTDGMILHGALASSTVVFAESGLRFEAEVVRGQKTGFFLDQRENRRKVGALANSRQMLNAFSFSGGFSLYAARAGATEVTDLDISPHALAGAERNFALNLTHATVAKCRHERVQADAFAWLEQNKTRKFDLVVLDPPSMAKRESERAGAIQAYAKLAVGGLAALRPGGVIVAASCSAHVSAPEFFDAVRHVATGSGRPFREIETTTQPPDHPATFPEAHYLKCVYLQF